MGLRSWIVPLPSRKRESALRRFHDALAREMAEDGFDCMPLVKGFVEWRGGYHLLLQTDGRVSFRHWRCASPVLLLDEVPHEPNGHIIGAVSLSEEQAAAIFPGLDEFLRLMSDL